MAFTSDLPARAALSLPFRQLDPDFKNAGKPLYCVSKRSTATA
jgi:hypothetical protein